MLEITYNGKRYRSNKGIPIVENYVEDWITVGFLEEIKEEKAPQYWYIETKAMKKSEYWEVFKEWFDKPDEVTNYPFKFVGKDGGERLGGNRCAKGTLLSPQQWYRQIYLEGKGDVSLTIATSKGCSSYDTKTGEWTDHDKAMDKIHGVVDVVEVPCNDTVLDPYNQCVILTKAVLQLQSHVFNQ